MSATATVEGLLFDFIARTYGSRRHGRKLLAAHAGVSVRAAETYIAGRHLPSVPTAVRLMQHHPDLLHEFMRLFDK